MQAVILSGGKATRLLPLTCNMPKAIVQVLNIPFMEHFIRRLAGHHVKDIVLALGHLAQPIEACLGDGSRFGVKLRYVVEDTPMGTAGAVKNAEKYLDKTFLVLNGDVFNDLDITALVDFHRRKKATATLALTPVDDPTSYGLVETGDKNEVTRFLEKPDRDKVTTNMINAGTYVLENEVLAQIPAQTEFSFERQVFPQLLERKKPVYAFSSSAYWIDIGTPERYLQLHRDLLNGKCPQNIIFSDSGVSIGAGTSIHHSAQIKRPVVIGKNCVIGQRVKLIGPVVIGDGCTIQEESTIEDSVIWRNVRLGPAACVKSSILGDSCCLNTGSAAREAVVGDNVAVASDFELEPGSRIWPGTTVEENNRK